MVYEYICSVFDRKVRELKYLSGSQSFSSYEHIKLQPDLIIRAIQQVASILRRKLS